MIRSSSTFLRSSQQCVLVLRSVATFQEGDPLPLVPEGSRAKIFNLKPDKHLTRKMQSASDELVRLAAAGDTDVLSNRFRRYVLENPNSHFIASGVLTKMMTAFSKKGEVERCQEILRLFKNLGRRDPLDPHFIYTNMQNSYLLSLMSCTDVEKARKIATRFLDAEKDLQNLHPVLRSTLDNVLRTLQMENKLLESMERSVGKVGIQADTLLNVVREELRAGNQEAAVEMFEKYSPHLSDVHLHADHFALLAQVVTGLYGEAAYITLSRLTSIPRSRVKEFSFHPPPASSSSIQTALCKNYELVLFIAREKRVGKLFRIIGGRDGLMRQLTHVTEAEYVSNVLYTLQLAKSYDISIDHTFWCSLVANYCHLFQDSSGRKEGQMNYAEFDRFYRSIRLYPLPEKLWIKAINSSHTDHLSDIHRDLMKIGMMSDTMYSVLVRRDKWSGNISQELEKLSEHYSLVQRDGTNHLANVIPSEEKEEEGTNDTARNKIHYYKRRTKRRTKKEN